MAQHSCWQRLNQISRTLFLPLAGLFAFLFLPACQDVQQSPLPTLNPVAQLSPNTTPSPAAIDNTIVDGQEVMQGIEETDIAMDQGKEFVISLWHNWQGPAAEALARVVADYEARHPNVRLELIYQESLVEALDTAVAAGEGPDLFITTQDQLGRFADSQTITPLSDQFDTTYLTANFIPATVDAVTWQEQVWGLPLMEEGIALVYNPALIDSSLIPEDKTDFAGLLNSAQSFHAAHPESYLFCNESLSATSLDAYHSAPIFFGFGGAEEAGYIDDWGTVHINTPERQAAAEWLQSLQPVIPAEVGYEICLDGLQSGEFAAWWTGPWSLEALQNAGVAYKIQGFGRPYVHVTSLFMGADAVSRQHDAPAAEFMEFWADPGVQTSLALAAGSPPASLLALQSAEVQANPEIAAYGAALADGIPFPSTPYANTQWDPLAQATAAILSGSQPPATALAEAQTAVEQAVAEMTQP